MSYGRQRWLREAGLFVGFIILAVRGGAATTTPQVLTTAAEVRSLSVTEAEQHYPVRLRGVVTFYDANLFSRFLQDDTAGIYLNSTNIADYFPGQLLEVEGYASAGEYAPVVVPERLRILGQTNLPPAKPVSFEQLASGKEDSQFVEVDGTVRAVKFEKITRYYLIELATGGGRLTVYAHELPILPMQELVDSAVRIKGVCTSLFNRQRQLIAIRLLVPRVEDLTVVTPAGADPYAIPTQSISSLFQFTPQVTYGHRIKVTGTVAYFQPGVALYLRNGNFGVLAQTKASTAIRLGDQVEVLGFAAPGEYTPMLQDATYRKIGVGLPPAPAEIILDKALKGDFDCRLVRIEAKLISHALNGGELALTLEAGGFIFHAYLQNDDAQVYGQLENGSLLAITGICLVEPGAWLAGETWRAKSFRMLLRGPADIAVVRAAPWWTLQKMLWVAGALLFVIVGAITWIVGLRRQVSKQTEIIQKRLLAEAFLKERYENLFENANDMVFTHDRVGTITSINKTGERLLHQPREKLLSRNLIDFIAQDQQAAARQWLDQIVNDVDLPTSEWDFINAGGQRLKLEISSRCIETEGHPVEVEGIARDITERRRLEQELLDISNREQRRIGHDLHDGVCQQLAAINYLVDILGDRLQEKSQPEAAEAERIGNLINEANAQARNVARGLFPARLEEHGLFVALEELTASASSRYRITCRFVCQLATIQLDGIMELHLYYIVQEALLNAVNHGKSSSVIVTLSSEGTRWKLTVQDNGQGFNMADKNRRGMGLRIMKYRAKVIGAALAVHSALNQGTEMQCTFNPAQQVALKGIVNA